MKVYAFSKHALHMLNERGIQKNWVAAAIKHPDRCEIQEDGLVHYVKKIKENQNRGLRVIINVRTKPANIVTVFFDRRLRS